MFHPIDLKNYPRAGIYYYFTHMAPTGYSISVSIDVTNLRRVQKEKGFRFFPLYLWLVTRNVNKIQEMKMAIKDGVLGFYDSLTPLYASWHEETKHFSLMWTEFTDSYIDFEKAYLNNQKQYGMNLGVLCQPGIPPENAYTVSAIPWTSFSHFAVHNFENKEYLLPSFEAGKVEEKLFTKEDGSVEKKLMMPLSITCHHGATDGYHIDQFIKSLEQDILHLEEII